MTHRKEPRPDRANKQWKSNEVQRLERLADKNTPTRLIADALGRSESAVRNKASEEDISHRPTNQSPYNRRKR